LCLDPEAGAALANSWKSGPWSDDQTKAFSEVLAKGVGATSGSTGKKGRRDNQMATSFESYLSENDVQVLGSDASIGIKLDCVATRCCRLRLTLPSEQCVKSILAAVAARSGGTCTEAELFLQVAEFKRAAYDENDGPVTTLLPAGQVALKAMDISLRPTNKKVRGIFGTPNKATSAMVPAANGMGGMMGGMNPGMMGGMAGMMGMCGMPAASSMFGLMQWMKQQQE
ncbi:unnamed protein product, partial [Symbiodinium necroappetens]